MLKKIWNSAVARTMSNRDCRHIDLYGGKLSASSVENYFRSAATKAVIATCIVPAGAYDIAHGNYIRGIVVALSLAFFNATAMDHSRKRINRAFSNLTLADGSALEPENLCIDKNRIGAAILKSALNSVTKEATEMATKMAVKSMLVNAVVITYFYNPTIDFYSMKANNNNILPLFGLFAYPIHRLYSSLSAFYRFYKIEKGDWVISHRTPKEKTSRAIENIPGVAPDIA